MFLRARVVEFLFVFSVRSLMCFIFFFFNDTATTEIYTLSLHDALPICGIRPAEIHQELAAPVPERGKIRINRVEDSTDVRSEEHTSELQSRLHLVCRLLLEKKKKKRRTIHPIHSMHHPPVHRSTRTYSS